MIDITDYLIIQKPNDPNLYKVEIATLNSMFITVGETPSELFNAIDELSMYILELSAQLVDEYSTKSTLMEIYETQSAVKKLQNDTTILTEDKVYEYINEGNYTTLEKTESDYYTNSDAIDSKVESAYETMEEWVP